MDEGLATMMRVLVTSSRTWRNVAAVRRELTIALAGRASDPFVVVHGDALSGGDRQASRWVADYAALGYPVQEEPHPADWNGKGRRAGFIRNAEMVTAGADLCLAFIDQCVKPSCDREQPHGSHGATHCAELAEAAGIPTQPIWGWPQ